ncbi:MAG TPA: hypothetical protein VHB68_10470, partial [Steroidobacteraceae bacterium]|nr:hypothetical protein [Steroidobacteraceae bacterium]
MPFSATLATTRLPGYIATRSERRVSVERPIIRPITFRRTIALGRPVGVSGEFASAPFATPTFASAPLAFAMAAVALTLMVGTLFAGALAAWPTIAVLVTMTIAATVTITAVATSAITAAAAALG